MLVERRQVWFVYTNLWLTNESITHGLVLNELFYDKGWTFTFLQLMPMIVLK
jgi:hypothetical protein